MSVDRGSDGALLPVLDWRWRRFDALTVHELQGIHVARQRVFVIEQACAFLDADAHDANAYHLAAWRRGEAEPVAYARVLDPGEKYPEVSIGRVVTAASVRRSGLGRDLMVRAIAGAAVAWPGAAIRISAQSRLEGFYEDFGFVVTGERYLEDGIEHTEMVRAAASHGAPTA